MREEESRAHSWNMECASALRLRRKAATDMGVTAGRPVLVGVAGTNARGAVLGVTGSSCCPPGSPVCSTGRVWLPAGCHRPAGACGEPGRPVKRTFRWPSTSPSGLRAGVAKL